MSPFWQTIREHAFGTLVLALACRFLR